MRPNKQKERNYVLHLFISFLSSLLLCSNGLSQPRLFPFDQETMLEKINVLVLYAVEGGETHTLFYGKEDLRSRDELVVEGYISGAVVLSNDEVEAYLGGLPMSRIRENDDGTLLCKYFGPLDSMQSILPYIESVSSTEGVETSTGTAKYLFGGYSYFPKVPGTSVSPKDRFFISLKRGDASIQISVRQQASRTVFKFQPGSREEIAFQYQGTSIADHFAEEAELQQRLIAVSEGIRSAEKWFNMDLVTRVNIVDYEGTHNALTCEGEKAIWFYIKALREEPLEELKTIARHETLHLLVDRQGFARDGELRAHFADLKGFGTFSYERFMLIAGGVVLGGAGKNQNENENFFAFISERNFLEGMKGGHAHQNPDEFCTSFLHSLMFVERFTKNLDRPLALNGRDEPNFLTEKEKQSVLKEYVQTFEILSRLISSQKETSDQAVRIRSFLGTHLQAKRESEEVR
jgi:hypothetical protein